MIAVVIGPDNLIQSSLEGDFCQYLRGEAQVAQNIESKASHLQDVSVQLPFTLEIMMANTKGSGYEFNTSDIGNIHGQLLLNFELFCFNLRA